MAIVKIPKEREEYFTLTTHPDVIYVSGCNPSVVEGAMSLRGRSSPIVKEYIAVNAYYELTDDWRAGTTSRPWNLSDFDIPTSLGTACWYRAVADFYETTANISKYIKVYMAAANAAPRSISDTKNIYITRFDTPFLFNSTAIKKSIIQNNLMKFYESRYDLCEMSYTNYHTLNFFSAPDVAGAPEVGENARLPDDSAIIYQNFGGGRPPDTNPYYVTGAFSIHCYLNARYTNERIGSTFNPYTAGTIMHLSSSYALSLISGSRRDQNGNVNGYRLMLQLSHSADIAPRDVNINAVDAGTNSYPNDLIFLTEDNSISRNYWHSVAVRWGTKEYNMGTGSIDIDSVAMSTFVIPSGSILPPAHISPPKGLFVGNYREGPPGPKQDGKFFNAKARIREGINPSIDMGSDSDNQDPTTVTLRHPLNAEIHEVKIYDKYLTNKDIIDVSKTSPKNYKNLKFYVPPLFTHDFKNDIRDTLLSQTRFYPTASIHPFNTMFSFNVGGFDFNLEKHTIDNANGYKPRLYKLTGSADIPVPSAGLTANEAMYRQGTLKKRNLTCLPCDNGKFKPDYPSGPGLGQSFKKVKRQNGCPDPSIIPLDPMVSDSHALAGLPVVTAKALWLESMASMADFEAEPSPDDPSPIVYGVLPAMVDPLGVVTGEKPASFSSPIFTIFQKMRDTSSREICFFNISNIYYGNKILENTFFVNDEDLSGSDGKVKITLRDNGRGGLYRCDASTKHPQWANIGNILYEEGIVFVKSPILTLFGKDKFETKFKGEQNIHIKSLNIKIPAGMMNSSSNPGYKILSASESPSDIGERFVYIDSINIHDENLNVIMRGTLAQPIKKRVDDEMVIRFKMDF